MKRADYGLDAPGVVRTMGTIGLALLLAVVLLPLPVGLKSAGTWMGASFLLSGIAMIASSRLGKMRARDSLLDAVQVKPGDTVLDIANVGHYARLLETSGMRVTSGPRITP